MDGPSRDPSGTLGLMSSGPSAMRYKEAEAELLRQCQLDDRNKSRLFMVLEKLRKDADSVDGLITSFGNKCFKTEPTSAERFKASRQFCLTAFGDLDRLYRKGPKSTFMKMVTNLSLYKNLPKTEFQFKFGKYRVGRKLGEGATATVFYAEDGNAKKVAMKVFKPTHTVLNLARKEYQALKDLQHHNIIKMVEFFEGAVWQMQPKARGEKPRKVYTSVLIMEYAARGELVTNLISMGGEFQPELARWAFKGILDAIVYCHGRDMAHCDIKLGNCFVTGDDDDKVSKCLVGDFGFVTPMTAHDKQTRNYGTPKFYAPEMHLNMAWTRNVDLFSLGILLFVLLHGKHPFEKAVEQDAWYKKVVHRKWDRFWRAHHQKSQGPKIPLTDDAKNLLEGMLAYQPKDRLSLEQIRKHKWLQGPTYADQDAYVSLTHRKDKRDAITIKHAEQNGADRDIADWDDKLDVPAPLYSSNVPIGSKNWFYCKDSPRVALLWLSDIIKKKLMGWTDCETPYEEWRAWLKARKAADKAKEEKAKEIAEATAGSSGIKPSALKMVAASEKKAAAEAAPAPAAAEPTMELVPFGSQIISDEDLSTCEGRMYNGLFELNFSITIRVPNPKFVKEKEKDKAKATSPKKKEPAFIDVRQGGLVQVYAAPANPKISIVTMVSTADPQKGNWDIDVEAGKAAQEAAAANADPAGEVELGFEAAGKGLRQDLEVFSKVYEAILDKGGNRLLIDTRETRKELEEIAKKTTPNFDDLGDFLDEDE